MLSLIAKFTINLDRILGQNKANKIGIAVSGGADSVALLHLLVNYVKIACLGQKSEITVFTVDHNLRAESKSEINYVKELARKLDCHFISLVWHSGNKTSALQARARLGRYSLIQKHCKKLGITLLLTGHHLDDMLESYLIKKSKKAGAITLAPNITYFFKNLWIVRPLFDIPKQELINYLQANNIRWFEDGSNDTDKYERNRVRKVFRAMSKEEKAKLLTEYNLAIIKAKEQGKQLVKAIAESVSFYKEGFAKIDLGQFMGLQEETKIQLLNYVLTVISGKTIVPRYRNLVKILSSIEAGGFKKSTLSHCRLICKNSNLIVYKEKAFVASNTVPLLKQMIWDGRFELVSSVNKLLLKNYTVSSLTMDDYIVLKKIIKLEKLAQISDNNHKTILFTLPIIKDLEKVVAIPHISYYDDDLLNNGIKVIFKPEFISRFTHFF